MGCNPNMLREAIEGVLGKPSKRKVPVNFQGNEPVSFVLDGQVVGVMGISKPRNLLTLRSFGKALILSNEVPPEDNPIIAEHLSDVQGFVLLHPLGAQKSGERRVELLRYKCHGYHNNTPFIDLQPSGKTAWYR